MKKTPAQKEKENNLRRYKSAVVYNVYGRSDVADMAKSWSFEKIQEILGVKIEPKKLYRVPERQRDKAPQRAVYYDNYTRHRIAGYEPAKAFEERKAKQLPGVFAGPRGGTVDEEWKITWKKHSRMTEWRKYSSDKGPEFPDWMMVLVRQYNREAGFKGKKISEGRYGYAIMFKLYVEGWSEEAAKAHIAAKPGTEVEWIYRGMLKI